MADTVYYNAQGEVMPYDSVSNEFKKHIEKTLQTTETEYPGSSEPKGDYTAAIIVMSGFILLGYFAVKNAWKAKGTEILGSWKKRRDIIGWPEEKYRDEDERFRDLTKGYLVYHGHDIIIAEEQYDKILSKRSAYYRQLAPELKTKFIDRLKEFMTSRIFLIKSEEPFVDMPVLISATAIQLTFGLDKYLLPHYQYIRVFKEEYFASDNSLRVLAGHVYGNTITLAWNHFLEGNEASSDGVNLGLHEMAHALYFQLVEANFGRCSEFTSNFNKLIAEGQEVHEEKHTRPSGLFKENAYRNLQEFWAESVELFFERPTELKRENSELYDIMKEVLNQDPVHALYPVLSKLLASHK